MQKFIVLDNNIVNLSEIKRITMDKKRFLITFQLGFGLNNIFRQCNDSQHLEKVFKDITDKLEAERI